jgi:hypothetical protein
MPGGPVSFVLDDGEMLTLDELCWKLAPKGGCYRVGRTDSGRDTRQHGRRTNRSGCASERRDARGGCVASGLGAVWRKRGLAAAKTQGPRGRGLPSRLTKSTPVRGSGVSSGARPGHAATARASGFPLWPPGHLYSGAALDLAQSLLVAGLSPGPVFGNVT